MSALLTELRPPPRLRLHGVDIAGGYRVSEDHGAFGGDFYDAHPGAALDDDSLVVLGDVCGRGLAAATLATQIRGVLHAVRPHLDDHSGALAMLNTALLSDDNSRFATLVMASFVHRGEQLDLTLTCAGHPAPLILRRDGTVEQAATRGMLVGALPQFRVRSWTTSLLPGEVCLLYTDGITEARGGPCGTTTFGVDRLIAELAECRPATVHEVVAHVMDSAGRWVGSGLHDDMAVVGIGIPGERIQAATAAPQIPQTSSI